MTANVGGKLKPSTMNLVIQSLVVAGILAATIPTMEPHIGNSVEKASQLVELTPIVVDQAVFMVSSDDMTHVWIHTAGGSLVAEREGALGTSQTFDFSGQASGIYVATAETSGGEGSVQFTY